MVLLAWIMVLVLVLIVVVAIYFEFDDAWPFAGCSVGVIVISSLISRSFGPAALDPVEAVNNWAMITAGIAIALVAAYVAWRVFGRKREKPGK